MSWRQPFAPAIDGGQAEQMHALACFLLLGIVQVPEGFQTASLVVNGRPVAATDAAILDGAGRAYVSVGALCRWAGVVRRGKTELEWFGHRLRFSPNGKEYRVWADGEERQESADGPVVSGRDRLWVPGEMVEDAWGWKVRQEGGTVEIWGPGSTVQQVRQGVHPDKVRVVLDLTRPALYQVRREGPRRVVEIPPGEETTATAGELQVLEFGNEHVPRVTQQTAVDGWTRVVVPYPTGCRSEVLQLDGPPRIVVDVYYPAAEKAAGDAKAAAREEGGRQRATVAVPKQAGPASIRTISWPTGAGPAVVHLVAVRPDDPRIELRPALAGQSVRSLASVAKIASAWGAFVAVNGGFFSPRYKVPLGMLVIDREWIRAPLPRRPVLAIRDGGKCEISRVRFEAWVQFEGIGGLPVIGLNQNHWERDSVVVYTHRWGSSLEGLGGSTRLVVSARQRVVYRESRGRSVPIPLGGMVISGVGRRAQSLLKIPVGRQVKLVISTRPRWPDLRHALGGGPLLVAGGKPVLDARAEGFRSDVASGRRPRTAVAVLGDGRLVLVVAEGRPAGRGPGLSLWELTQLMLKLGATSAMNLDGGSSTTLVVNGRVVNRCSAGTPRMVNNALMVLVRKQASAG